MLRASVMSPRIFWYDVRHALAVVCRVTFIAALLIAAGWGVWRGIEVGLLKNEDFRLRQITLNENPALDEIRLLEVTEIDLRGSLFDCDPDEIGSRLEALPEIAAAKVVREFPGDLRVDVTARKPYAWIACEAAGIQPRSPEGGLLVDRDGTLFPCTRGMAAAAELLPVLHLREAAGLVAGEPLEDPDYHRGLRLLQVAERHLPEAGRWIDSIRLHKAWGCKLLTRDGIEATFGHDELDRQMADFLAAVEHARAQGDRIATISLIGRRNHPVTFHSTSPPRAVVVPEEALEPAGDADLRKLLER